MAVSPKHVNHELSPMACPLGLDRKLTDIEIAGIVHATVTTSPVELG